MADNTSMNNDTIGNTIESSIPRPIRFWLLLAFDIPAVVCTLFLLYHLFVNRNLRQALHNHVIIVLLIIALMCNAVDVPAFFSFLHLGYVWKATTGFCRIWWFIDTGLSQMIPMVMAFATIERHILVFHSGWVSTKKTIISSLSSLSMITVYGIVFYIIVIFFPPCENTYDYSQPWCSYPCYLDNTILATFDTVVNCLFPTLLIIILSLALLLRYICQRRRIQQRFQWRKLRKMIIQLVSISSLYLIFYLPVFILLTAHLFGLPAEIGSDAQRYAYFLAFFINLLSPYVCLASLPELWKKFNIPWKTRAQRSTVIPLGIRNTT